MKINCYILSEPLDGLADAVAEAMALFAFTRVNAGANERLSPNVLVITNRIAADTAAVETEVEFPDESGARQCIQRVSPAIRTDETLPAAAKRLVRLNLLAIMRELTGYNPGPWGILRGVRPSKIVHRLLDKGVTPQEAVDSLVEDYALAVEKARLITDIAVRQRPVLLSPKQADKLVSVYVGIPFCPSRCRYCSFPAYVLPTNRARVDEFLQALERDITAAAELMEVHGLSAQTLYIGGGTPTSLGNEDFARVLDTARAAFVSAATGEITVEAGRPDSITDDKIAAMKKAGVTRVSVNPQTMQEKTLKLIGRNHNVQDIIEMFSKIRQTGFPVINMDIIIGLPGETEDDLADTLQRIACLEPDNLTVHTLAIKKGSSLKEVGDSSLPPREVAGKMLRMADSYARNLGMAPYYLYRQKYMAGNLENIGYAKPGSECLYNIQIIEERQTIIGVGPAAGTKAVIPGTWRLDSCYNPKDLRTYVENTDRYLLRRSELLRDCFSPKEE